MSGTPTVVQTKATTNVSTPYSVGSMPVPPGTWQLSATYRTDLGVLTTGPLPVTVTAGKFGSA